MVLTPQERDRYCRQLSLKGIGTAGQNKLKSARVLIVGVGGLGCPAAMYLAGAGVGKLGLIDPDRVEVSNLHRQPLFSARDVGKFKVEVATQNLEAYNSLIKIDSYPFAIDESNALAILEKYDIVLDATDNFETRYLVNDACFFLKKLNVFASVTQFEGRLTVFSPEGPCYRCLYPTPPEDLILNCVSEGILGPVPGFWGTLQAIEALKLILNIGENAIGVMQIGDLSDFSFKQFVIEKNPTCPLCSDQPKLTALTATSNPCTLSLLNLNCRELQNWMRAKKDFVLIDVREKAEFNSGSIPGALSLPLSQILNTEHPNEFPILPKETPTVFYCRSGQRSLQAIHKLRTLGFCQLYNLSEGYEGYVRKGLI